MNMEPAEIRARLAAQMEARLQHVETLFRESGIEAKIGPVSFSEDQKRRIRKDLGLYYKRTTADQMIDRYTAEINRGITEGIGKSADEYLMYHEIIVGKLWAEQGKRESLLDRIFPSRPQGNSGDRVGRVVQGLLSSSEKEEINCISLAFLNQVEWLKVSLTKYLLAGLSDRAVQALKSFFEERGLSEMVEQAYGGDPVKAILHAYPSAGEALNVIFKILDEVSQVSGPEGMRVGTFILEHTLWAGRSGREP